MVDSRLELHPVTSPQCYARLRQTADLPLFDPSWLSMHQADAHWVVIDKSHTIRARCSLWWQRTPSTEIGKTGLIGHYASQDDSAADMLLQFVVKDFEARGCRSIVGPMDQSTWRDYRFVIEANNPPASVAGFAHDPFLMEPFNVPQWPEQFMRNGFQSVADYFSALVEDLAVREPRLQSARNRLAARGIIIRSVCVDDLENEIRRLFPVVKAAFADHLYFTDVTESEFLCMYASLRERIREEIVLFAEESGRVVGFCFGIPDFLQAGRGQPIDTVIVKTLGVLPEKQYAGLGQILLEDVQHRALEAGFKRGIHALVRDIAPLRRISLRYGHICRRYALFGKDLPA